MFLNLLGLKAKTFAGPLLSLFKEKMDENYTFLFQMLSRIFKIHILFDVY